jgi:hypothetical protein
VIFEVFRAVTMKNEVFCDVTRVTVVRIDVSEERIAYIIRMTRWRARNNVAVTSN